MCVFGGGDDEPKTRDAQFLEWLDQQGGLDAFDGDRNKAWEAFVQSGAFTDRAEVPGPAAEGPTFLGPRIETDRNEVSDLKTLPGPPKPSSAESPAPRIDPVPDTPRFDPPSLPRISRSGGRGSGRNTRRPVAEPFSPIPTIETR